MHCGNLRTPGIMDGRRCFISVLRLLTPFHSAADVCHELRSCFVLSCLASVCAMLALTSACPTKPADISTFQCSHT